MRMRHASGSVGTTYTKIKVKRGIGQYLRLRNTDDVDNLLVSFDNGRNYNTMEPNEVLEINALFHFIVLLGAAADVTYELLIGEG